jgi:hypothetical protein
LSKDNNPYEYIKDSALKNINDSIWSDSAQRRWVTFSKGNLLVRPYLKKIDIDLYLAIDLD